MEETEGTVDRSSHTAPAGKVGIVTVTYNSGQVLPDFFQSLACQTYTDFVLIAIDNASTDSTLSQLREQPSGKLIVLANANNVGVAAANNQGIREALAQGCGSVLLLNNDVSFGASLIADLVAGLAAHGCDMTTPLIYYSDESSKIWAAGGEFQPMMGYQVRHKGENEEDRGQYDRPLRILYAPTCCVLVRRRVFERIGLMDERYFVYSDDVDFMYRAMRAGLTLFLIPQAKLWHKVNSLTGGALSDFSLFYGARGRALFLSKHLGKVLGGLWSLTYLAFYRLRPALGMDTLARSQVRIRGILEGRRIGAAKFIEGGIS